MNQSYRNDPRIYTLNPNEILAKDYKQIQKDIHNRYQVEITLQCVRDAEDTKEKEVYCAHCVKERSLLSAKNKIGNIFELPDPAQTNKTLYCLKCDKGVHYVYSCYKGGFQHIFASSCTFYDAPSKKDLSLDAIHKMFMILRWNPDISLEISCVHCSTRYDFPIEYDDSDWVYFSDQNIQLTDKKGNEKFLFSFLPTQDHKTYTVDPNEIHRIVRENKRKLYFKPITIPCTICCHNCLHAS
jgi:hypothetical protein